MRSKNLKSLLSLTLTAAVCFTSSVPSLAKSTDPNASAVREARNAAVSQRAATEGMVLLDNEAGVLPIAATTKVALYGAGVYNTVKGGTGSGNVNQKAETDWSVKTAFKNANYDIVNEEYLTTLEGNADKNNNDEGEYDEDQITTAAAETDTAIYVLARNSGENADRAATKGDYYLTDTEYENLALLGQKFKTVIVVLNVGGVIDTNFYHGKGNHAADDALNRGKIEGLDALLLMSQAGQRAGDALVQILNGAVNPSGKLTDTWAIEYADYPSSAYYSLNNGINEAGDVIVGGGGQLEEFYTDDIYVGYRYFDTYGKDVAYPFGYGGSYTSFSMDVTGVEIVKDKDGKADKVSVKVDVYNTGAAAGKEVVEVYYSAPAGKLNKPYQELAAYTKTAKLDPKGTSTTSWGVTNYSDRASYTVEFNIADMASYDEENEYYIMEKGTYTIRVGNSSRNTVAAATFNLEEDVITEECRNNLGTTRKQLTEGTYEEGRVLNITYGTTAQGTVDTQNGTVGYGQKAVTGILDGSSATAITVTPENLTVKNGSSAITLAALKGSELPATVTHTYDDGNISTYYTTQQVGSAEAFSYEYAQKKSSKENLAAGDVTVSSESMGSEILKNADTDSNGNSVDLTKATLVDVYEGKITMDQLVATMSLLELSDIVQGGTYAAGVTTGLPLQEITDWAVQTNNGSSAETTRNLVTSRLIPSIIFADGPAGVRISLSYQENGDTYYQYCTAFPIGTMLAQTWNTALVEEVGHAVAREMLEYGVTSWLAPGMNIHRNPLCGRNFEYYSEDPVVSGSTAAAEAAGVQTDESGRSTGLGVTLKHFALNNQETIRFNNNSVVSERAAREIYLKGFEIAVKSKVQPNYIMSSYNMINGYQAWMNYGLLTEILRNEWGFEGFVMTDWNPNGNSFAPWRGLMRGVLVDRFEAIANASNGDDTEKADLKNTAARAVMIYAGNDSEMPGAANYGSSSPNVEYMLRTLDENITASNGDAFMRLGDLQRCAANVLNVIMKSNIFADFYKDIKPTLAAQEAQNAQAEAEKAKAEAAKAKEDAATAQEKAEKAEADAAKAQAEAQKAKGDAAAAQAEAEKAKSEAAAAQEKADEAQTAAEAAQTEGAAAKAEAEQAKKDAAAAQAEAQKVLSQAQAAQTSASEALAQAEAIKKEAEEAKAAAEQAKKEAQAAQATADKAAADLKAAIESLQKPADQPTTPEQKTTITVSKKKFSVKVGKKLKLAGKVTVSNANGNKVAYKSNKKKIASVNSKGVVTGKKKGTAKITISCNGAKQTVTVTVK